MIQAIAAPYANLYTWKVTDRYFAFFIEFGEAESGGTLYMNSSIDGGVTWTWRSLGSPPSGIWSYPSATAFSSDALAADGSVIWQFYVFVVDYNNNELWVAVSVDDGQTWHWQNQGFPAAAIGVPPQVHLDTVSRLNAESWQQDIFCYVIGGDGNLWVNYSQDSGATWQWTNRGAPSCGLAYGCGQSSIAFFNGTRQSIYAFAVGGDGNLYANYGDGSSWNWVGLEQPSGSVVSSADWYGLSSVTFLTGLGKGQNLEQAVFVFAVGRTGSFPNDSYQLFACYSPGGVGTGWQWKALGSPFGTEPWVVSSNALLVTNESNAAVFAENVFVFADCIDSNRNSSIYAAFTPNAALGPHAMWTWQPLGLPPGSPGVDTEGAVASIEIEPTLASVQIFLFAEEVGFDRTGEVYTCRWDGSAWSWHDQQHSLQLKPKQHALQQLRRQATRGPRREEQRK